jgi:hypothetical protein
MLTHKEMTAHIRKRLKVSNIPARVKMNDFCGSKMISVVTPSCDARWDSSQLRQIGLIAQTNRLSMIRSMPIDVENLACLTGTTQINFEFHGA